MERLNIFATKEETERMKKALITARNTPVIAFSSSHALNEGGLAGQAHKRVAEDCHALALAHGLPEIEGFYGLDCETGEFVKA
ncbi:hypothetical protein LCGC14_1747100 [marine sediment metagenome]|uniref:Uncharacterized protein n=1 Tax=marine sediment metagenome TaxID=412755 RepID=A0A0F9H500_9ZZZZ